MSNIHEMLSLNGGSFARAEKMALDLIAKGDAKVWLDLALLFAAQGKQPGLRQAQAEYAKHYPDCPRLAFGRTWLKLHDGDLQGGLEHIEAGRACGTLGDPDIAKLSQPKWDGKAELRAKTVLLYGEGGQGDQMMGLRSAQALKARGAAVVVACTSSLMSLFRRAPGVDLVVQTEAAGGVAYDYWVPMMSSFRLCGATWETLWPGVYLTAQDRYGLWERIIPQRPGELRVGIRFSGNPEFEHEQLRWFPPELLLRAVDVAGVQLYSLQKELPSVALPSSTVDLEPLLGDWEQTAAAIDRLDLVITSCTSIAHLAAAMGKPTWVVVPAMPYYPWARPGSRSDWYPTVTLFRQECYGEWQKPFDTIHKELRQCVG